MHRYPLPIATTVISAALLAGCNSQPKAPRLDEVRIMFPKTHKPGGRDCTGARPSPVGCTTLCKPCKFHICVNGEWKLVDVPWPDEMCEPKGGLPPAACPREPLETESGAVVEGVSCPAECRMCF